MQRPSNVDSGNIFIFKNTQSLKTYTFLNFSFGATKWGFFLNSFQIFNPGFIYGFFKRLTYFFELLIVHF